jgi:integrase
MKRTAIGAGAYVGEDGRYWERPRGKTWRLMRHVETKREAIRVASSRDPNTVGRSFQTLANLYSEANCPDARLKPRGEDFCKEEKARVVTLVKFFGNKAADKVSIADIPPYHAWRSAQQKKGLTGNRAVDKETQTLSNIFRYAVAARLYPTNPVGQGRPRYQVESNIKHSYTRAPKSSDACHRICDDLLSRVETEVAGWFCLFAMFTGCRSSELLRLRVDAKDAETPGFIQWRHDEPKDSNQPLGLLHIRRSKHGINPECIIGREFAEMLLAFNAWHSARFPDSAWYFPNLTGEQIHRRQIYECLVRAAKRLGLPHVTPHGFRSFYVTKRRSDGVTDTVIAGETGDKTVALMQTTYGERPKNWLGGDPIGWLPKEGKPAWEIWQQKNRSIDYGLTTAKVSKSGKSMFSMPPVWRNGRRTGLKINAETPPIEPTASNQDFPEDYQI